MRRLEAEIPPFVETLVTHRPPSLRGKTLSEALCSHERAPARLGALFEKWSVEPGRMYRAPPSLTFAVLGQARAEGRLSPEEEAELLAKLLTYWAMRSTLDAADRHAPAPMRPPAITGDDAPRIFANQEDRT